MITIEIMLIMAFTLLVSAMYVMYRHFQDANELYDIKLENILRTFAGFGDEWDIKFSGLHRKLKDDTQNDNICHKSAIESIKRELERLKYLYEKQNHGSIKVVMPEIKEERKSNPKKESK